MDSSALQLWARFTNRSPQEGGRFTAILCLLVFLTGCAESAIDLTRATSPPRYEVISSAQTIEFELTTLGVAGKVLGKSRARFEMPRRDAEAGMATDFPAGTTLIDSSFRFESGRDGSYRYYHGDELFMKVMKGDGSTRVAEFYHAGILWGKATARADWRSVAGLQEEPGCDPFWDECEGDAEGNIGECIRLYAAVVLGGAFILGMLYVGRGYILAMKGATETFNVAKDAWLAALAAGETQLTINRLRVAKDLAYIEVVRKFTDILAWLGIDGLAAYAASLVKETLDDFKQIGDMFILNSCRPHWLWGPGDQAQIDALLADLDALEAPAE